MLGVSLHEARESRHSVLVRLITSYLFPTIVIVLIITTILTYVLIEENEKDVNGNSLLTLSNLEHIMAGYLENARSTTYEIYNSGNVTPLLYTSDISNEDTNRARVYLDNMLTTNTQMYSVYVISDGRIRLRMGGDDRFTLSMEEISGHMAGGTRHLEPRPVRVENEHGAIDLVAMAYSDAEIDEEGVPLVVSFHRTDSVSSFVTDSFLLPSQRPIVVHHRGEVLINLGPDLTSPVSADVLSLVGEAPTDRGFLRPYPDEKNTVLHYVRSKNERFTLLLFSDRREFYRRTIQLRNRIVVGGLVILALVVVWAVYLLKFVYKPIDDLFSTIRNLLAATTVSSRGTGTRSRLLSRSMDDVIRHLNSLEHDLQGTRQHKSNQLVRDLISHEVAVDHGEFTDVTNKLGLIDRAGRWCVVAVRIDGHREFLEVNSRSALLLHLATLESVLSGALASGYEFQSFTPAYDQIYMLIRMGKRSVRELRSLILGCRRKAVRLLTHGFTAGMSSPKQDFSPDAFREALVEAFEYTNYRLCHGVGGCYAADSITIREQNHREVAERMEAVLSAARREDRSRFRLELERLMERIKEYRYETVIDTLARLTIGLYKLVEKPNGAPSSVSSPNIHDVVDDLKNLEEPNEIVPWFDERFDIVSAARNRPRGSNSELLCERALQFIHTNFRDPLISASALAGTLGITPQYFSRIFSAHAGRNFPDYVNDMRLHEARRILETERNVSIKDLSVRVGFYNNSYFATAFRKKFGLPPSRYTLAVQDQRALE